MNSNKKRNLIRKFVGLTASMAIASIFAPSTPSITQVVFAEEAPAVTYKVKYKFISNTPGKELPQRVLDVLPGDEEYPVGSLVQPTTEFKKVVGEGIPRQVVEGEGYWVFQGFDSDARTIKNGDVVFTGKWKWFDYIDYSYVVGGPVFVPLPESMVKEAAKLKTTRISYADFENHVDIPENLKIIQKLMNWNEATGKYEPIIMKDDDAQWEYHPKPDPSGDGLRVELDYHKNSKFRYDFPKVQEFLNLYWKPIPRNVEYEFVSGTKGKEIEGVLDHLKPVHKGTYYYYYRNLKEYSETKIVAEQPKQTTFYDSTKKGTWTFVSYDVSEKLLSEWDLNGWNLKFTGTWTFVADEEPAPEESTEEQSNQTESTDEKLETTEVPTTQKEANVEQPESTEVQTSEKVTEAELPNTGTTGVLTTVIVGVCIALSGFGLFAQGRRKES